MRRMLFDVNGNAGLWATCYLTIITVLVAILAWSPICSAHRGPHHPRGGVRKGGAHFDQHLAYEKEHIAEDLKQFNIPGNKEFSDMTENELNFLYFKAHDLDGNGKLDGLEMYYSATHHSLSQADHEHEHESEHQQVNGYGDKVVTGKANFRLLSPSGEGKSVDVNFNHVVEILDNFLEVADLNKDGYLQYPEYAAALKLISMNVQMDLNAEAEPSVD